MEQSIKENGRWITTDTGSHVFIKEGQSVEEALADRFDEEPSVMPGGAAELNKSRVWARGMIDRARKKNKDISNEELINIFKEKYNLSEEEIEKLTQSIDKYREKFDSFEEDSGIPENKERGFNVYYAIDEDWPEIQYSVSKAEYDRLPDKLKGKVEFNNLQDRLDKLYMCDLTVGDCDKIVDDTLKDIDSYNNKNDIERAILNNIGWTAGVLLKKAYEKEINDAWRKRNEKRNSQALESLSGLKMNHKPKYNDAIEFGNELYDTSSRYKNNCYKCAQWFDLYMRGYGVSVQPSSYDENGKKIKEQYDEEDRLGWHFMMYNEPVEGLDYYGYKYTLGGSTRWETNNLGSLGGSGPSQLKNIKKIVKKAGPGSRFMIVTAWQSGSAHAFNAYCDKDGEPHIIDVQHQRSNVDYYFDKGSVKTSKTMLVRIDNLTINENYKKVVR